MGKVHQSQKKPAQPTSLTTVLAARNKITVNRNQTSVIQSSGQTHLDLRIQLCGTASNSSIGIHQHSESSILRSILNTPWFIHNYRIHADLQVNPVHSKIRKRSDKCLNKLENHSHALAVSLLGNTENISRLKRYSALNLPDRFE
jgi:hypothetical protein